MHGRKQDPKDTPPDWNARGLRSGDTVVMHCGEFRIVQRVYREKHGKVSVRTWIEGEATLVVESNRRAHLRGELSPFQIDVAPESGL